MASGYGVSHVCVGSWVNANVKWLCDSLSLFSLSLPPPILPSLFPSLSLCHWPTSNSLSWGWSLAQSSNCSCSEFFNRISQKPSVKTPYNYSWRREGQCNTINNVYILISTIIFGEREREGRRERGGGGGGGKRYYLVDGVLRDLVRHHHVHLQLHLIWMTYMYKCVHMNMNFGLIPSILHYLVHTTHLSLSLPLSLSFSLPSLSLTFVDISDLILRCFNPKCRRHV